MKITVTISGPPKSGKKRFAVHLRDLLVEHGVNAIVDTRTIDGWPRTAGFPPPGTQVDIEVERTKNHGK